MAWVNENGWKFEQPTKRHCVRQVLAKTLVALADTLNLAMHMSPAV
jgi:hypothetical protein